MPLAFQAVLLASDTGSRLYPLNSPATPKALLPIGNKAMLSFPLAMLEAGGVTDVLIVCSGEATAAKVTAWVSKHYTGSLHIEVKTSAENIGTAEAVRHVAGSIRTEHFLLLSSDLVTDMPLRVLIAAHFIRGSVVSCLLYPRRTSPSAETKPGKAPKNVDYVVTDHTCVGLDESKQRLLFYASDPEARRDVKIPLNVLRQCGKVTVRTDLSDAHLYIFNRAALLRVLEVRPAFTSVKQDVIPFLVRHQRMIPPLPLDKADSAALVQSALLGGSTGLPNYASSLSHGSAIRAESTYSESPDRHPGTGAGGLCSVFVVGEGHYCARANTPQNFGEVNRDVATPQLALHLLGPPINPRHDNWVDAGVKLGAKTTVGAGCIIGPGTSIGDKGSVKRSVVGADCKIGSNAKVINSVIMDEVVVGDHAHIQNTIVCRGSTLHDRCSLRDCQVGAGYAVAEGAELRDEVLAKTPRVSVTS